MPRSRRRLCQSPWVGNLRYGFVTGVRSFDAGDKWPCICNQSTAGWNREGEKEQTMRNQIRQSGLAFAVAASLWISVPSQTSALQTNPSGDTTNTVQLSQ